ncbi:MAG: autotransporter domain-containing protein [Methylophilaceae bacterium]
MNLTHRVIWSKSRNTFIVASEGAKARGKAKAIIKPSTTRKTMMVAVLGALGSLAATPAFAAPCPAAVGGTVTVLTPDVDSTCGLNSGESLLVTNTGSITDTTGTNGVFAANVTPVSITNNGSISADQNGILISSSILAGSIINSGSITSATGNGISLQHSTVTGDITNNSSGTISADQNGILITSSSILAGSITNSGSITSAIGNGISLLQSTVTGDITNNSSGNISAYQNGIYVSGASVGSITNSGSISVTNPFNAYAIFMLGGSTAQSITNNGSLSGQAGIDIGGSTVIGDITNNSTGVINGTAVGVYLLGSQAGSIINSGTISGDNNAGIYVTFSSISGDIINNNTISGGTNGIAISSSNVAGSITNSGTISGGVNGIFISSTSHVVGGITNTGSIIGDVVLNDATLNLNGTTGSISGAVSGAASSVVNVNGTFTSGGAFSVDTFNIASGGRLNIANTAHSITTTSGFNNAGTLAVADGVTATIMGDYSQSAAGVFQTTASSAASFGQLVVSGTASLAAGTGIRVDVTSGNTLAAGNTLASVISAGTLTATTFTVTDNSLLFDFTAAININAVDLLTSASATGVADSVAATGFDPGRGAAVVLDGFVSGGATGTDTDNVVTALGQLGTQQQVSNAVAETLPMFSASMPLVELNILRETNRVIEARRNRNRGMSSGDEFLGDSRFWLKPVGSWINQDNRKGVAGFNVNTHGLVGGVDGDINDNTRIGLALSYMRGDVDGKSTSSGNSADIDSYQGVIYGSHSLTAMPDTSIDWQANLGTNKINGRRAISFLNREAKSDYDSLTAHAGVGISRSYTLSEQTTIIPTIRADYTWLRSEGYTETGADALNLQVKSKSADELILLTEGRYYHAVTDKATLSANLGVGYDVLHNRTSVIASYVGGGASFSTPSLDASPWLLRGGLGLVLNASETTEVTARYDVETRRDYVDNTASVKVKWAF